MVLKTLWRAFGSRSAGPGLSLVYSRVRRYGGELSLRSPAAANRGAGASIKLPLGQA